MPKAFLSIGSNDHNKEYILKGAIKDLQTFGTLLNQSSLYKTPPWGGVATKPFLNGVIAIEVFLSPKELLLKCQEIEHKWGRNRAEEKRWGDRSLDIDILTYDEKRIQNKELIIPHPYIHMRAFVLIPLLEIEPHFFLNTENITAKEALRRISKEEKRGL